MNRRVRWSVLFLLLAIQSLSGCQDADERIDKVEDISPQPSGAVLEPGDSTAGLDGVTVFAPPETLAEAVAITIDHAVPTAPLANLPSSVRAVGEVYSVHSEKNVKTQSREFFEVGLPVPEGVDVEKLSVAVVVHPVEVLHYEGPDEDFWELFPGTYDADPGVFVVTTPYLRVDGMTLTLVEGDYFVDLDPEEETDTGEGLSARQSPLIGPYSFHVLCEAGSEGSAICTPENVRNVRNWMYEVHEQFQDDGWVWPLIHTRRSLGRTIRMMVYLRGDCGGGLYESGTGKVVICTPNRRVVRHEYFHAVEYGHTMLPFTPDRLRSDGLPWRLPLREAPVIEGMATAAQDSLDVMTRATVRVARKINIPLFSLSPGQYLTANGADYEAQDFFVFLGMLYSRGMSFFQPLFESGGMRWHLDELLRSTPPTPHTEFSLAEAYWLWVRNQAFEKTIDLDATADVREYDHFATPCHMSQNSDGTYPVLSNEPNSRSYVEWDVDPQGTALSQSIWMRPLTATMIRVDYPASNTPYAFEFAVDSSDPAFRAKIYDAADAENCAHAPEQNSVTVSVPAGESGTYYALVANTIVREFSPEYCERSLDCPSGLECVDTWCVNDWDRFTFTATLETRSVSELCSDGIKNSQETDVDCGGPLCAPCADNRTCSVNADCVAGICQNGVCGLQCSPCESGQACLEHDDCRSGICEGGTCRAPDCEDGVQNGHETGIDCGGPECAPCDDGHACLTGTDCASRICQEGRCQSELLCAEGEIACGPTCVVPLTCVDHGASCGTVDDGCNGVIDCGQCGPGAVCTDNQCVMDGCDDGVQNGQETDVDCGGPECAPCDDFQTCLIDDDCLHGVCEHGACQGLMVEFVSTPPTHTSETTAAFEFVCNRAGCTFECSLNSDPAMPCASPVEYVDLFVGTHTFQVEAHHGQGAAAAAFSWNVDTSGPIVCPEPQVACDGVCTDIDSDTNNCGACGNACAGLEICDMGVCANP